MNEIIKEARKRLKRKKEFKRKFIIFILVSMLLLFINFNDGPSFPWSLIAIGFWGIKIGSQWRDLYVDNDKDLEREIEKVKRLHRKSQVDELDEELDLDEFRENRPPQKKQSRPTWDDEDLV